jgi:methionine-rich copper-binding protein CopC
MARLFALASTALTLFTLIASSAAHAHAVVVNATPVARSTIAGPDCPVDITFNSRIDVSRSRLAVIDDAGKSRPLTLDAVAEPNRLRATARGLAAGGHVLEWYVLSTDGHITRGRLKFTVGSPD